MNPFEIPEFIQRYTEELSSEEELVLQELYRTTHLKTVHPQMLSGKVQGRLLSFISQMIRPEKILEIGTFTGYSAYCLSKGLNQNGKLITIEVNEELEEIILKFFDKAGILHKTDLLIGDALEIIPSLDEEFDLVFIDANKELYIEYYEAVVEKLKPGAFLLADNILWGGKVADQNSKDASSRKLHEFNTLVRDDVRMESVLLTVRDGIMVARRR